MQLKALDISDHSGINISVLKYAHDHYSPWSCNSSAGYGMSLKHSSEKIIWPPTVNSQDACHQWSRWNLPLHLDVHPWSLLTMELWLVSWLWPVPHKDFRCLQKVCSRLDTGEPYDASPYGTIIACVKIVVLHSVWWDRHLVAVGALNQRLYPKVAVNPDWLYKA